MSKPRKYKTHQASVYHLHLHTFEGKYFISYGTTIVFIDSEGKVTLDKAYWEYSRATIKHRIGFLGEPTDETRTKIKSGEYKLANLN